MTKEEILRNFDETVKKLFSDSYYYTIEQIMKRLDFSHEDMRRFIGKDIGNMSPKHALNAMSGLELLKLMTLVTAKTAMNGVKCEGEQAVDNLIDEYNKTKQPRLNDKVDTLLKLFGVTNETDLDNLLAAVTDVKEAIRQAAEDIDKASNEIEKKPDSCCEKTESECKCGSDSDSKKGAFEEKHECRRHGRSPYSKYQDLARRRRKYWADKETEKKDEKKCGEVEYYMSYYDSDTMDEPSVKSKCIKFDPKKQSFTDVLKELQEQLAISDSEN